MVVSIQDESVTVLDPDQCEEFGMYYDCAGNCIDAGYLEWNGDGVCDDDGMFGVDFNCEAWNFDLNDCIDFLPGDVNEDGVQNILDIVMIVQMILDELSASIIADLSGDGEVNVVDIILLVNIILED